jgi:hypothetical protein
MKRGMRYVVYGYFEILKVISTTQATDDRLSDAIETYLHLSSPLLRHSFGIKKNLQFHHERLRDIVFDINIALVLQLLYCRKCCDTQMEW